MATSEQNKDNNFSKWEALKDYFNKGRKTTWLYLYEF